MTQFIVVEDRTGEWWEGALVDQARARQLEAKGVVLLPVVPDLFKRSGVGGFTKRAWGSGWMLDSLHPRVVCPLTMFCAQQYTKLSWAAKVIPTPEMLKKLERNVPELLQGFIKIAADAGQAIAYKAGVSPTEDFLVKDLTAKKLTEDGAFILRGTAKLSLPADAHYGFALYAMATGLGVVWLAASQSIA